MAPLLRSECLHGVSDSCDVTFPQGPGKHILYQLDHRGVCLAVEITEKKPMTCRHCEDRPLPLKHPNSVFREKERDGNSGGFTAGGIYSLFQFARGLLIFSSFLYLFILFPNSFLIHLKGNKISSQMHKYCQSE